MTYGDFKYLAKRTAANKFLKDRAFNIAEDLKYDIIKELSFYGFKSFG